MGKVEWSEPAKEDLLNIHNHISSISLAYADSFIDRLISKTDILESKPRIGRKFERIEHDTLREFLHAGYRIIYSIQEDRVFILRALHSSGY